MIGGMDCIMEQKDNFNGKACNGAGSPLRQRETMDTKENIRVISIFGGAKTASEAIHQAAVKKILFESSC